MRSVHRLGLSLGLWLCLSHFCLAAESPNVVLIFADDMGYGDIGAYNPDGKIPTPNLDKLISQGMQFTDAHSSSGVCSPSRYALLTGRYSWRTSLKQGVLGGFSPPLIEEGRWTLGDLFHKRNYKTACIGKWHLGMNWSGGVRGNDSYRMRNESTGIRFDQPIEKTPLEYGFDYYFGISASLDMPPYAFIKNDRVTALPTSKLSLEDKGGREGPAVPGWRHKHVMPTLADQTIQWIENNKSNPFFVYLPLNAPHTPHAPNDEFLGKGRMDVYSDFMIEVDHTIGRVMDALERMDLQDSTLLIVTSDNGPETNMFSRLRQYGHDSSSHFLGAKRDNWEGGHRVPFIARWPGVIEVNSRCDTPICLVDFMATFADLLEVDLPEDQGVDSVTVLPLLKGKDAAYRQQHPIVHHSSRGEFGIRQGKWKLLLHSGSGGNGYGGKRSKRFEGSREHQIGETAELQLYDLDEDPNETTNLASSRAEKVKELIALTSELIKRGRSTDGPVQPYVSEPWPQIHWLQ